MGMKVHRSGSSVVGVTSMRDSRNEGLPTEDDRAASRAAIPSVWVNINVTSRRAFAEKCAQQPRTLMYGQSSNIATCRGSPRPTSFVLPSLTQISFIRRNRNEQRCLNTKCDAFPILDS